MLPKRTLLAIHCLVFALVALSAIRQGMPDPDHYRVYANGYAAAFRGAGPWPNAYRPPLYPLMMAPFASPRESAVYFVALLHVVATFLTIGGVAAITYRIGSPTVVTVFACLLTAISPILVFQAGQIMTETVFTALAVWTLFPWLTGGPASAKQAAGSGLVMGLAYLVRPTMGVIFLAIGFTTLAQRKWPVFRRWLLAAAAGFLIVVPWALCNWMRLGLPVFATTHGGYTLWLANNPSFYKTEVFNGRNWTGSPEFEAWQQLNEALTQGKGELEKDRAFRRAAIDWIAANPADAAHAAAYRLISFWGLQPRTGPPALRPAVGIYYGLLFLLAAVGWYLVRGWQGRWLTATMVVVAVSLVHAVYWSNMRFRAPLEPLLAIWAAIALERMWRPRESSA